MNSIVEELEAIKQELTSIGQDFGREGPDLAFEKLSRWKERSSTNVAKLLSPDEGEKLRKKQLGSYSMNNPQRNFQRKISMYDAHLSALIDEARSHPEAFLDTERKEVSAKVDSLSNLHSEVLEKCRKLYEDGAYAEAAEKSFKVVRDRLRTLTGYETGSDAFGRGNLHIIGAAAPHVDDDFNQGVKFLTMAIDRFRNEKSHTSDAKITDPVRAYEYLRLSSLAMNLLDQAEITTSQ